MLRSIRKFSTSIYAKILLGIIVIPFVFWGMGSSFIGGSKNIVVVINKEKYSIQEFSDFIQKFVTRDKKIQVSQIEELLSSFIGEKLMENEVRNFEIKLSDDSLAQLIKHQKEFEKENKFSRIEYEKFLIKNNITSVTFENNLSQVEKKKQLLDFIGSGIIPPKFLVNVMYDKINQKRNIEFIDLNDLFIKKITFSENQIKSFFEKNKDQYKEIYKSIKLLELNPRKLMDSNEFNDLFFKKLDEIDDMIIQGKNFDYISKKFNLGKPNYYTVNAFGKDINSKIINEIPKNLIKNIFDIGDPEATTLIETKDRYFIIKIVKTENIQKNIKNESVRKEILLNLKNKTKRKLIAEIINKINKKNFTKFDFDKFSKEKNVLIKKIILENQNDSKILKKEIINQIYNFPEKKIIVVHDISFSENLLIYIDKIENVSITKNSNEYQKYLNLSKIKIKNELYNTYDNYIKKRYKIDINYQALETVKNYFN